MKKVQESPASGHDKSQETKLDRRDALAKLGLMGLGLLVAPTLMTTSEGHAHGRGGGGGGRGGRGGGSGRGGRGGDGGRGGRGKGHGEGHGKGYGKGYGKGHGKGHGKGRKGGGSPGNSGDGCGNWENSPRRCRDWTGHDSPSSPLPVFFKR